MRGICLLLFSCITIRTDHRLNGHEFEQTLGDGEGQEVWLLQSMGSLRVGHDLATEKQQEHNKQHSPDSMLVIFGLDTLFQGLS